MERGRPFYISLLCGLAGLVLLIVSMNLPAQLVFETKPYARLVLMSGKLDNWTAASLGLEQSDFDLVKANYAAFLKRNRADSSESDDSDSDEDENYGTGYDILNTTGDNTLMKKGGSSDSSMSSSDLEGGEDSDDSSEEPSKQRLQDAALSQHIGLGLFHGRVCEVSQQQHERCHSVSTNEAVYRMSNEVKYMMDDINMAMWNNLRVESIFSALACVVGLVFLLSTLRPCCDNDQLPKYISALAFSASGVLVFIPIVRIFLVSSDFQQNLEAGFNVTTKRMTSWSLVVSGLASPLVLAASFSIIATNWMKMSKKLYHKLTMRNVESSQNGHIVELSAMHKDKHPPAYSDIHRDDAGERGELVN